jgi:hypothetical protein
MVMKAAVHPRLLNDPVFQRVLREGLAIQDRFSAEPVYGRTGKGQLKPAGVEELRGLKAKGKSGGS